MPRVLHVLSQRPSRTGSGVTLDALVRHAGQAGWEQAVAVGVPADDPTPTVAELPPAAVHPLLFDSPEMPFPVPGMSDVMPYPSSRFGAMTADMLAGYRDAWRQHLARVVAAFRPDLVHSHHVWLVSSSVKDTAPEVPLVVHCHATGFRQLQLCPHVAPEVVEGCARADAFAVLHRQHAEQLTTVLGIGREHVPVVGAGYRDDLFHATGRDPSPGPRLLFVGKYSAAKGLPWLLDAVERLTATTHPQLELHVVGSGGGDEAAELAARMAVMGSVIRHGQLDQDQLARLARRCHTCVLPSFYEGLPLVLVEALACGCRLVATALPGVIEVLSRPLDGALELVPLPRLESVDRPDPADLPAFVDGLERALRRSMSRPSLGDPAATLPGALAPFTWEAVFRRVEAVWRALLKGNGSRPKP